MKEWSILHIEYIQNNVADWQDIQRISQDYRLIELASHLLDKLGIHRLIRYLGRSYQQLSNIKGWIMRYCILKAIQDATIDETNVELKVTCGRKVVTLKSSDEEACNLRIEVAIQCDEGEPMVKESEVEHTVIVDPGCGDQVRRSRRKTNSVVQADTPGLVNCKETCYGICVLHTFAYLMKLYPILREHRILEKLSFMQVDGRDKISREVSRGITDDIVNLMMDKGSAMKIDKRGKKSLKQSVQDSSEFLSRLVDDIEERDMNLEQPFHFELVRHRLSRCPCEHAQIAKPDGRNTKFRSLQVTLGILPQSEVIDVARLIQYGLNIGSDPEVRTYEEGSKRCSKCIEDETPNPDNSEGLCRHNFNPCLGCGKQILETQSWDQFKTVPKVLIIPINRLVYDTETQTTSRLQHCVQVNSHIQLQNENDVVTYQIVSIICHKERGQDNGHYKTYIRSEGQWRLFNDSEVTDVPEIATTVCGRDVAMCYYVPTDSRVEILEKSRIGTNERMIEPRTRSEKRLRPL